MLTLVAHTKHIHFERVTTSANFPFFSGKQVQASSLQTFLCGKLKERVSVIIQHGLPTKFPEGSYFQKGPPPLVLNTLRGFKLMH